MTNKDVGRVFSYHLKKQTNLKLLSLGGAGVHVQPDCWNRSSDDAPGLRHGRLGGEPGAHHLPGIHEVNMVVGKNTNPSAHKCGQLFPPPRTNSKCDKEFCAARIQPQLCPTALLGSGSVEESCAPATVQTPAGSDHILKSVSQLVGRGAVFNWVTSLWKFPSFLNFFFFFKDFKIFDLI